MKKRGFFLFPFLLAFLFINCAGKKPTPSSQRRELPISKRKFLIGVVPNPAHSPNSSFKDLLEAFEEVGKIAEVCPIWVEKQGIGEFELLKRNRIVTGTRVYGLKPLLTLNFATIKKTAKGLEYVVDAPEGIPPKLSDQAFRSLWLKEAENIAKEFKPEYFSLGNEINDYFHLHPEDLKPYLSLLSEAYRRIKEVSPQTKVLVVFSYNHLIENNQLALLKDFEDKVDLIGLTTYPYKQFPNPNAIPKDYYERLKRYVKKPLAFTEIGWSSGEGSSEKMQADFLLRFLELTKEFNVEMVNWLFLHETVIGGIAGKISNKDVGTIALKKANGRTKEVYYIWLSLKELKREPVGK
jgi:hypothetical protein